MGRPPLVAPQADLAGSRLARYSRQVILPGFDEIAQRRLANARGLVIGAGGLGSIAIPALAAAGVGTIGIVDADTVELSNLHRQLAYSMADVGRRKTEAMADAAAAIDPDVRLRVHDLWLDSSNAMEVFAGYDLVLDGSDNFATRYLVDDAAALSHIPLVWGAILRYSGQASVSWADAGPTFRDLFPEPPAPGDVPSCSEAGVLPGVCTAIGSIMATEAIKVITGVGEPLIGRVTTYDALTGRYRELSYERDPNAWPVTELVDYEQFCGRPANAPAVENTATREAEAMHERAQQSSVAPGRITPEELAYRREAGEPLQLIDVREPFEARIASIEGSRLVPLGRLAAHVDEVRRDVPVVLYCHHGPRSRQAADLLHAAGVTDVVDVEGGIDAYAQRIDPTLPRY